MFPTMMTLSANLLKISLPWVLPRQIYHWLAHNSINFEFAYSLLLIPPIHEYSTVRKMQCSVFTGDKQFTNEQISNIKFHLCPNFLCQVYPSSLPNLARLHIEKFLVLPTKSWNDTNTCSNFPWISVFTWWQDQIYSSVNYIHCSAKVCHYSQFHNSP